jgi:hypothetical protein
MTNKGFLYLTPREKQLLRRFACGKTDAIIAVELGESRIAAQRKRLVENFKFSDDQRLIVTHKLALWSCSEPSRKQKNQCCNTQSDTPLNSAQRQR